MIVKNKLLLYIMHENKKQICMVNLREHAVLKCTRNIASCHAHNTCSNCEQYLHIWRILVHLLLIVSEESERGGDKVVVKLCMVWVGRRRFLYEVGVARHIFSGWYLLMLFCLEEVVSSCWSLCPTNKAEMMNDDDDILTSSLRFCSRLSVITTDLSVRFVC